jgi:3-phenylpropionate/cinnamic acid dioxygenase small subunit
MSDDDLQGILGLLADYCHTLDDGRIDDHLALYADDCVLHVFGRTYEGKERVRKFMAAAQAGQHLTGVPKVDDDDDDLAHVRSDFVFFTPDLTLYTAGTYHDVVRKSEGTWRFVSREIGIRLGPRA